MHRSALQRLSQPPPQLRVQEPTERVLQDVLNSACLGQDPNYEEPRQLLAALHNSPWEEEGPRPCLIQLKGKRSSSQLTSPSSSAEEGTGPKWFRAILRPHVT